MMRSELEELAGKTFSIEDYADIQKVYLYHPLVTVPNEKDKIVALYKQGGMGLIRSLLPDSRLAEQLELDETNARMALQDAKDRYAQAQKAIYDFREAFQP